MKTPPFLMGATLLFWGWQSGWLIVGAVMAAVLEGSRWIKVRWEFSERDFDRLWNLCTVLFLGAAVCAFTSSQGPTALRQWFGSPSSLSNQSSALNQTSRALLLLIRWLPMVFFPFIMAQAFSRREEVDWSTFSWILRWAKLRARTTGTRGRAFTASHPYFGICILAACVGRPGWIGFNLSLCLLLTWALWRARSRRFAPSLWAGLAVVALALSFLGNRGLEQLYAYVQNYSPEWLTARLQGRFEAKESRTSIGSLGRQKLSGRIVLRVEPKDGHAPPALLREASYTIYRSPTWYGAGVEKDFQPLAPEADEATWTLVPRATNDAVATIAGSLPGGHGLLPLANGTGRLQNLPASVVQTNRLGAVRVDAGPGFVMFDDAYGRGPGMDSPPTPDDSQVPEKEAAALVQVGAEVDLDGRRPEQALKALGTFFQDRFGYSLLLSPPPKSAAGQTPLGTFLLRQRAGHCEYFATAAVLLLRNAGLPARYAVGYAVQERSGRGFVVRQRHVHAWCLVYYNGAWRDFDPTPASWFEREAANASWSEFLSDAWSRLWFEFTKFRYGQSGLRRYLLWLVAPLIVLSLWRLIIGKQWRRFRPQPAAATSQSPYPGQDSEVYRIEEALAARGLVRGPSETFVNWLKRMQPAASDRRGLEPGDGVKARSGVQPLPDPAANLPGLGTLLQLHYRYRFDPEGLSRSERENLRTQAEGCLQALRDERPAPRRFEEHR